MWEKNVFPLVNLAGTGGLAFIFSVLALGDVLSTDWTVRFFSFQGSSLYWGGVMDLTAGRYILICLVINLFCKILMVLDKQENSESLPRFFVYLDLFLIASFVAIISNYFCSFFIGWELFGILSYLFLSFSYEDGPSNQAAFMAFLFDRFGSILLFFAGAISFFKVGDLSFDDPYWKSIGGTFIGPLFFAALYIRLFQFGANTWFMYVDKSPSLSLGIVSSFVFGMPIFLIISKWGIVESSGLKSVVLYGGIISLACGIFMAFQEILLKKFLIYLNMAQWGGVLIAAAFGNESIFLYPFMVFSVLQIIIFGLDKNLSMDGSRQFFLESLGSRVASKNIMLGIVLFWTLSFGGILGFLSAQIVSFYPSFLVMMGIGCAFCSFVIWKLFFWILFFFPSNQQSSYDQTESPIMMPADNTKNIVILKIATALFSVGLLLLFQQKEIRQLNILNFTFFSSIFLLAGVSGWALIGFFFREQLISGFLKGVIYEFFSRQAYLQFFYEKAITGSFKWLSTSVSEKIDIFLIEEQAFQGTLVGLRKLHHFFENTQKRTFSSHVLFILFVCIGLLLFMMFGR
ncbi:MAG: proton-conducting transporter membrane subunit [Alphaproteobacteria bacterium]